MDDGKYVSCNIQKQLADRLCETYSLVIDEINRLYGDKPKYFHISELMPDLKETALDFSRNRKQEPFYYCSTDDFAQTLATGNIWLLVDYKLYFFKEFSSILENRDISRAEMADLLSERLNSLFEAIDDARIWGIVYSKKIGVEADKILRPDSSEIQVRNIARMTMLTMGYEQ